MKISSSERIEESHENLHQAASDTRLRAAPQRAVDRTARWGEATGAAIINVVVQQLLNMLEVSVCIVTIDSMGCQKNIAKTIVKCGADYALSVKKN